MRQGTKNRRTPQRKLKPQLPGWIWLLCAAVAGFAFAEFIPLITHRDWSPAIPHVHLNSTPRPEPTASAPAPKKTTPHFDFYRMLPKFKVVVPHQNAQQKDAKTRPNKAGKTRRKPVATPGAYMLQVGSFRHYADADRLRARLALLGVESHVQEVKTHTGQTWNRVRIGPIDNLGRLNKLRARLHHKGIAPMVVRVDGGAP
jgi:cell division protein FtsN